MKCKVHWWVISVDNIGVCKLCGKEHDFTEDNRKVFPENYPNGFSRGSGDGDWLESTVGAYYMQGSLVNGKLWDLT